MKRKVLFMFSIFLLISCSTSKIAKEHSKQLEYIPKAFHNTYLGMPLTAFKQARNNAQLKTDEGFRTTYSEEFNEGDIKQIIYYVGTKDDLPLYEYVIEYHSKEKRDEFVEANLGKPNSGEEWRFDSKEGFTIRAWIFSSKLIVTGLIKDSEWYNEEKNAD